MSTQDKTKQSNISKAPDFLIKKSEPYLKDILTELDTYLDSRLEKPESWLLQGFCSVESSKGKRLTRIKRGFYKLFKGRICVPGYKWTAVLVSAIDEVPSVCQMSWWTIRGKYKE